MIVRYVCIKINGLPLYIIRNLLRHIITHKSESISRFLRVYHPVADTCTSLRAVMIYQVCDLDKKTLQKLSLLQSFLERITG